MATLSRGLRVKREYSCIYFIIEIKSNIICARKKRTGVNVEQIKSEYQVTTEKFVGHLILVMFRFGTNSMCSA